MPPWRLTAVVADGARRLSGTDLPFAYRVRHELVERPKVSILIPSKDKTSLLSACVESIVEKTSYDNYEIVVDREQQRGAGDVRYYEEVQRLGKARVVEWRIRSTSRKS